MSSPREERIETADGQAIVARFFAPPEGEAAGAVLIAPAMGVVQDFYEALARWLAGHGFLVATFDYRGTGRSLAGSLRGFAADILDWARLDCGAMVEAVLTRAPGKPCYWIGHSLGAQILPFVPGRERIEKVVTVAAGSGYWRENTPSLRWRAPWLWFFLVPVVTPLFGYFPGKRLRKVGDVPRGVIEQWRRWCLDPDYAAGAEGEAARAAYAAVTTPIVSLSFTDDEFMSARNIEALHALYTGAPKVMKRLAPADIGEPRIGHFGFFRPRYERSLWRPYLLPELGGAQLPSAASTSARSIGSTPPEAAAPGSNS